MERVPQVLLLIISSPFSFIWWQETEPTVCLDPMHLHPFIASDLEERSGLARAWLLPLAPPLTALCISCPITPRNTVLAEVGKHSDTSVLASCDIPAALPPLTPAGFNSLAVRGFLS